MSGPSNTPNANQAAEYAEGRELLDSIVLWVETTALEYRIPAAVKLARKFLDRTAPPAPDAVASTPLRWAEMSLTVRLNDGDFSPIVFIDDDNIGYTSACVVGAVRDMKAALLDPRRNSPEIPDGSMDLRRELSELVREAQSRDEGFNAYTFLRERGSELLAALAKPVEAAGMRDAFEQWMRRHFKYPNLEVNARNPRFYEHRLTAGAWEAWQAALAHPRPTGDVSALPEKWTARLWPVVFPTEAEYKAHTDAMDYCAADLRAALRSADMTAPTGEQAGEVVNDPYETGWADGYKQAETDGKLIALAQPRPTGDDVLHLARRVVSWMDSAGYSDGALPYDMGKDVRALRDALGDRGYTSSTVEQAGEVDAGLLKAAKSFVAAYIERYGRPVTGHGCFADVRQNAPMREEVGALNEAIYIATKAQLRPVGVPNEWLSEQVGGEFDDMSAGQGYRRGWNDCRAAMLAASPAPAKAGEA